ncbi:MAG: hypothetical protein JRF54_00590 [Deltaproteobacteria bacterium]|nr:hypothetical protein [Deltaproteobacteria bacterium]
MAEAAPDDPVAPRGAAKAIMAAGGMDASASKEIEEAAKLDPGHEMVKNLRKQLGG